MAAQKMHKNTTKRMQRLSWHWLPTHTHTLAYAYLSTCMYVFFVIYLCMPAGLLLIEYDFRGHTLISIAID